MCCMSEQASLYIYIVEPFWGRQQYEIIGLKVAEISDGIGRGHSILRCEKVV